MATLVATFQTMQHGMEQAMQDAVQSMKERVAAAAAQQEREQRVVLAKVDATTVSMPKA
jgi:hypothetical protein